MFGEPARSQWDLNFMLFGIPVRIHPYFWLAGLLLGPHSAGAPVMVIWMAAFFIGILCHELGHAMVMRAYGYYPWITLYGLGGLASHDNARGSLGGWPDRWRQLLISAAGPAAGFLLAALTVAIIRAKGHELVYLVDFPWGLQVIDLEILKHSRLAWFINSLLFVTIVYGIFNLLPIYPLDGGHMARELFLMINPRGGIRQSLWLSVLAAGGIAAYLAAQALRPLIQNQESHWQDAWAILFFGYLAYASYQTLQIYSSRGRWY
ncbi:MAG: site-2 protease family protein [Thermoguttaceae bacterium]